MSDRCSYGVRVSFWQFGEIARRGHPSRVCTMQRAPMYPRNVRRLRASDRLCAGWSRSIDWTELAYCTNAAGFIAREALVWRGGVHASPDACRTEMRRRVDGKLRLTAAGSVCWTLEMQAAYERACDVSRAAREEYQARRVAACG